MGPLDWVSGCPELRKSDQCYAQTQVGNFHDFVSDAQLDTSLQEKAAKFLRKEKISDMKEFGILGDEVRDRFIDYLGGDDIPLGVVARIKLFLQKSATNSLPQAPPAPQVINYYNFNNKGSGTMNMATGNGNQVGNGNTMNNKQKYIKNIEGKKCEGSGNGVEGVGAAQVVCCFGQNVQCCGMAAVGREDKTAAKQVDDLNAGSVGVGSNCTAIPAQQKWDVPSSLMRLAVRSNDHIAAVAAVASAGVLIAMAVLWTVRSRECPRGIASESESGLMEHPPAE